jgi:nucleoside-diphosphate-sugar epimerase
MLSDGFTTIKDSYLWSMDLVTGGTGIVGRELLSQLLSKGGEVRALRRESSDTESVEAFIKAQGVSTERLSWVNGDTREYAEICDAIEDCNRVYHLAALVSFHPSDEPSLMEINRGGTANVVNAMLEHAIHDLVYVSSVAALGHTLNKSITEETSFEEGPLITAYSRSKYESELEVWRGQEEGLSVLILNPSVIIGEGDFSRSSGELFSQSAKGIPVFPAGKTGFVSARDVAGACLALAESGIRGERFILSAENISYKDAMGAIAYSVGAKPPTKIVKWWMINLVVFMFAALEFFTGRKSMANKTSMRMAQLKTKYDGSKILRALEGWEYESVQGAIDRSGKAYLESV